MNLQEVNNITMTEGTVRTIHDSNGKLLWGKLTYSTTYDGDTEQDGTPTPSSPVDVDVVTGTQTVTINGKNLMMYDVIDMTDTRQISLPNLALSAGTYTISFDLDSFELGTNTTNVDVNMMLKDASNNNMDNVIISIGSSTTLGRHSSTFTIASDAVPSANANIRIPSSYYNNGARAKLSNIQIEKGSTATNYETYQSGSFTVNLGTTELCKIETHKDYIYKSGDNWYWHKEIDKIVLDGSEDSWNRASIYGGVNFRFYLNVPNIKTTTSETEVGLVISNKLLEVTNTAQYNGTQGIRVRSNGSPQLILYIDDTSTMDVGDFKTWLTSNNIVCYYVLATPTDTQITDATLITQLDSIHQFLTRYGYTGTVSGSLPFVITQTTLS